MMMMTVMRGDRLVLVSEDMNEVMIGCDRRRPPPSSLTTGTEINSNCS